MVALAIGVAAFAQAPDPNAAPDAKHVQTVLQNFEQGPLTLEPNRGQASKNVDFIASSFRHKFLLSSTGARLEIFDAATKSAETVQFQFVGANASAAGQGLDKVAFNSAHFMASDKEGLLRNLPNYSKVLYRQVWPGIDVLYYGNRNKLEYDLIVAAGANPDAIKIKLLAQNRFSLTPAGDLLVQTRNGTVTQHKPLVYQMVDKQRKEVAASYEFAGADEVRIRLGKYDRARELVIDPTLTLSSPTVTLPVSAIAVDPSGNIYVAGTNGGGTVTVLKFDPIGTPLVEGDFLADTVGGLAVTPSATVYLSGSVSSTNFFTTPSAFQTTLADPPGSSVTDAFILVYKPNAQSVVYSSFFGGVGSDAAKGLALDRNTGLVYITGQTVGGSGFTTTVGPTFGGGGTDGFLAAFDPNQSGSSSLAYSTYFGGNGADSGNAVAIDSGRNAYVAGSTTSTSASFRPTSATGFNSSKTNANTDGFILKVGPTGTPALYLTFLPLAPVSALAVDGSSAAYVTGAVDGTTAALATTASGFQVTNGGNGCSTFGVQVCTDAFLSKYDTTQGGAGSLLYSTYLGGTLSDAGFGVAVDTNQNAYVVGRTNSSNFPTMSPLANFGTYQGGAITNATNLNTQFDGFIAKVNTLGFGTPSLVYSTYLGGSDTDQVNGVAVDNAGNAFVGGGTSSTNFPNNSGNPTGSGRFGFFAKISDAVGTTPILKISKSHIGNFTQGQTGSYTVTVSNTANAGPTSGTVTVTETAPTGLTVTSMAGIGWTCNTSTCTRSDVLAGGFTYPTIAVNVSVAGNAGSPLVNQVSASGGGSATANASDSTIIVAGSQPSLKIVKTHTGNFAQGQQGATYTLTVSNNTGAATTSGTVTVTDTVPSGLTLVSMAGTGWNCAANTCTRSDALAGGNSYPAITVTVNVSATATSPQVNQASVSGGGSATSNISDSTIININQATLSVNRTVLNYGFFASLVTSPQTVLVTITGGLNVAWTATSNRSNIIVNPGTGVGTGTFQVTASIGQSGTVTVTAAGAINSPQTIQVNIAGVTPTLPFGSFDTPLNNTTGVVGAIPVTGWALDNIEVTRVDIMREPNANETPGVLVFIGTAVFSADARPDVQNMFPTYPYQYRAGWGYQMLTNFLPNSSGSGPSGNGTYRLHAIAFNKAGNQLDLGTKTIVVDNAHAAKPFGTIDTPGQGGTVSGIDYVNFGWALTPQPANIPIDGSTITVIIDGAPVAHPVYNNFRSDIASLFPGYANSNGAIGFYHLNTIPLANGVHTISWNAFDNLGRGEGLGSRYFNVLNTGGGGSVAAPEDPIDESVARGGVRLRHGLNVNRQPDPIAPDADGGYSVTMEEVGRIELHLGAAHGNMLVAGEAGALPTGSTLKGGIFYWQPGPGFLGDYTLQFERPDGSRIPVRVSIVPKRY
jgi:uncharacterized repeat protein (TIGR01451 family)